MLSPSSSLIVPCICPTRLHLLGRIPNLLPPALQQSHEQPKCRFLYIHYFLFSTIRAFVLVGALSTLCKSSLVATMYALVAFVFLFSGTLFVRADNAFLNPPAAGYNATAGSPVTVRWITDWGTVDILLAVYQKDNASSWRWQSSVLLG